MEDLIEAAGPAEVRARRPWRAVTVLAVLALVCATLVVANGSDGPLPGTKVVMEVDDAGVVDGGTLIGFGAPQAQIDTTGLIRAIVCPILDALLAGPFGAFIAPVINSLRVAFGCVS